LKNSWRIYRSDNYIEHNAVYDKTAHVISTSKSLLARFANRLKVCGIEYFHQHTFFYMRTTLQQIIDVPSKNPADARRRALLNMILFGTGLLCIAALLVTFFISLFNRNAVIQDGLVIYLGGVSFLVGIVIVYAVNRAISGAAASTLFLVMWLVLLPMLDNPLEVSNGRSLFIFFIPIVISSVLLKPYLAFVFASLSAILVMAISFSLGILPNFPAILGFFLVALVSWLSARSLETALAELLRLNEDLDIRVAERTQAINEILAAERAEASKNQAILNGIADGVLVLGTGGRVIAANPALERLVGIAPQDIMGRKLNGWLENAALTSDDRERVRMLLSEPINGEGSSRIQWGQKTLLVSATPVNTVHGYEIGKAAVFHDYTSEAEVDRLKSDFVAMVSHELRTPLNSILGYLEMLDERFYGPLQERQLDVIERLRSRTDKLLGIVNDLLDQAQIEAGQLTLQHRPFCPNELVENLHGILESFAENKRLILDIQISDDLPEPLYGDPQRLSQVLMSLVNNAVKFTEQGVVQVRLYCPDETHWALEVSDTGEGIPEDARTIIFDPFRQADMQPTRKHAGIGLGLTIVQRLIHQMQGTIRVESQIGRGSTFTVVLPLEISEYQKELVTHE
jgi:PAS domain S-box-containing protein